jgi:hypothetical protein
VPYTMADFRRDYVKEHLRDLTPEERLAGLSPEQLLAGLSPEERVKGLSLEQLLAGLPPEECETLRRHLLRSEPQAPSG